MNKFNFVHISHKTRNNIALSFILFLVLVTGGYYAMIFYPKRLNQIDVQIEEKVKQISVLEFVGVQLDETLNKISEEELKLSNVDKQVVAEVTPATTYRYLNDILNHSGFLKFDMVYSGLERRKSYNQNVYSIKGEGDYNSIYKFMAYIEDGPETYNIRKLHLHGVEGIDEEEGDYEFIVTFEMDILALYAQIKNLPKIQRYLGDRVVKSVRNPFYPIIKKELPPNYDELLEVERAELKAIMPGKAFVVDHKKNTHILTEGDEIYLGYVRKIDEQNNRVQFTLDKGGIIEEFILDLRFNAEREK